MIVTFPNFGDTALILSKIFSEMGIEYVMPEKNSKSMLKKGSEISPEDMCIPFKYMMGNFMSSYERGADTALMMATAGPCRLGEYGQLFMEILKKNGYDFKWILIDSPSVIGKAEFFRRIKQITGDKTNKMYLAVNTLRKGIKLVKNSDKFKSEVMLRAGYMRKPYEAVELLKKTEELMYDAENIKQCLGILQSAKTELNNFEIIDSADPVKIFMTGEIYTSMEKDANGYLQYKLMKEGCSVKCNVSLWWWIKNTIFYSLVPESLTSAFYKRKGIFFNVGGYSRETISDILNSDKFDGIIKVMPSGCMPEIVAKSLCERMQKEGQYKILHLIYDEMSGNTGYETRIEAFIDTLERRKHVLAGDRYRLN